MLCHGIAFNILYSNWCSFGFNKDRGAWLLPKTRKSISLLGPNHFCPLPQYDLGFLKIKDRNVILYYFCLQLEGWKLCGRASYEVPQYPQGKLSGTVILFEKCQIRCVGTSCLRAIFNLRPVSCSCRTYMLMKWHADGKYTFMLFVADFRPDWPLIKVNVFML